MSETVRPYQNEFAALDKIVAKNRQATTVPTDTVELVSDGARLQVREWGAVIVGLALAPPLGGEPETVLYAGPDIAKPNPPASFAMSPVGKHTHESGGRHGKFRRLRFSQSPIPGWEQRVQEDGRPTRARLVTDLPHTDLHLMAREFQLSPSRVDVKTRLHNLRASPINTSVGEYLYMACEGDVHDLKIYDSRLNGLVAKGTEKRLKMGKDVYWPEFAGYAPITLPNGRKIILHARPSDNYQGQVGMVFSHAPTPKEPWIVIQTTLGVRSADDARGIQIQQRSHATLNTHIELIQPATT